MLVKVPLLREKPVTLPAESTENPTTVPAVLTSLASVSLAPGTSMVVKIGGVALGVQLGNSEGKRYGEGKANSEKETEALKGHIDLLAICRATVFYDENSSLIFIVVAHRPFIDQQARSTRWQVAHTCHC